jgi:hypothetical protein
MVPCKESAIGLGGDAVGLLVLGAKTQHINKQRGGRGLCPGGRRSIKTPNNQPKVGGSVRGDDRGEARWAESEGEGVGLSFGAANKVTKKN